jgi:formate-dependent nitrite reductase membrane component NrfD
MVCSNDMPLVKFYMMYSVIANYLHLIATSLGYASTLLLQLIEMFVGIAGAGIYILLFIFALLGGYILRNAVLKAGFKSLVDLCFKKAIEEKERDHLNRL